MIKVTQRSNTPYLGNENQLRVVLFLRGRYMFCIFLSLLEKNLYLLDMKIRFHNAPTSVFDEVSCFTRDRASGNDAIYLRSGTHRLLQKFSQRLHVRTLHILQFFKHFFRICINHLTPILEPRVTKSSNMFRSFCVLKKK